MRLIDADKLDWEYIEEEYYTTIDTVRACKCLVLNAPTIEVEPVRHGRWCKEEEYGDLWVCDQCGFASEYKDNCCSNCGAKMDKSRT